MQHRRTFLGSAGAVAVAALAGCQGTDGTEATDDSTDGSAQGGGASDGGDGSTGADAGDGGGSGDSMDAAVTYARNVEEVRGHLTSSVALLERGRRKDAALHAGHGSDYYGPVLTPLRDVEPDLATRLRGRISGLESRVRSLSAGEYASYVDEEVFPLLEEAMAAVVPADLRDTREFDVRVMNALAGRIAGEYTAAVPSAGTVELAGEYWDARGFLTRIEARYGDAGSGLDGAGGDALERLRGRMEDVAAAGEVRGTTLAFRVETAAAAPLSSARVEGREDAVSYVRNLEELRGHLVSSATLVEAGDDAAAGLHAGHGADYVTALLPAVRRAEPALADRLLDRLLALDDRVADGADAYTSYLDEQVLPLLDRIPGVAVPGEFTDSTAFSAAVVLALAGRLEDEYTAAVTDEEVIELYGEYWDARGFLTRIEARFEAMREALDAETREEVAEELEILRTELETAATPDDVAGSVAALERMLAAAAEP
jgi:hypothetical protein